MGLEITGRTLAGADIRDPRWSVLTFDGPLIKQVDRFDADDREAAEDLLRAIPASASGSTS